jgi:hypothetical protein
MLGFSFNTATIRTGTLVAGEVSHHFGWPVQIPKEEIIVASLSPIQFTDEFAQTPLGQFGAKELVRGFTKTDKTQLSVGVGQLLGRRLGAAQSLLTVNIGWIHVADLPGAHPADADSWGYRIIGQLTYEGILGGFTVRPRVLWTHDVGGDTPPPAPAFIEDRKSFTAAVGLEYASTVTADVGYTTFFDGKPLNILNDRDFVRFNLVLHY